MEQPEHGNELFIRFTCPLSNFTQVDELTTKKSVAASHRSQFGQTVEMESASDEEGDEERDPFDRAADTADPVDIELYSRTEQFFGTYEPCTLLFLSLIHI